VGITSRSSVGVAADHTVNSTEILERVASLLQRFQAADMAERAAITLSYAQSIDGSIAANMGACTQISGQESNILTHRLRAMHDAILVGVGTILVDDPQLTVRHVSGEHPRPVIVDSLLRTPVHSRVLQERKDSPLIVTTRQASAERQKALMAAGATVLRLGDDDAELVDLALLFAQFRDLGIESVMIEGGASVIASLLRSRLADQLVLSIAPRFLGGLHAVSGLGDIDPKQRARLTNTCYAPLHGDLVVYGEFERTR
jgi:3,4-dihydroxy 2-butanone 4-phosphate synthase/GTP cyclohydrolase II